MTTTFDVMTRLKATFAEALNNLLGVYNKWSQNSDLRVEYVEPIKELLSGIIVQNSWHNLTNESLLAEYYKSLGINDEYGSANTSQHQFLIDLTSMVLSHFDKAEIVMIQEAMLYSVNVTFNQPLEMEIKGWMITIFLIKLCAGEVIRVMNAIK